ncbi:hypothetical protein [Weissella sagaensis]|jgi:hypothetical protein|uniref:Uncharacterized protein n=1 Tax=Weissella sagaensis TaxID=2559928 RepID=A0ABW1RUQ6_9LACO|nr:hypothetical protein [Weissella sagaensis]KAA8432002.1 hypothetical protein FKV79_08320 [Weissella paramesenteroides]MBU7567808.1 hypothetical protein [Weissella hellenica]KAA8436765.1 hypothetical protein FKV73_07495 [Weissella paramesenteroides]QEA57626.1 hypothetical protein FGL75_06980 [Weissella hellenica]UEG66781.1 hypothetical protein GZH44_08485 [Weissella hellenica]
MRLGDLKISLLGMPLERPLATQLFSSEYVFVEIMGKEDKKLILTLAPNQSTTIHDLQKYDENDLEIMIRDSEQLLHKIYGYRIIDNIIVLA